jgi:DNA-directed RNA polymerase subunit M/transcription elongation factor TFIIS
MEFCDWCMRMVHTIKHQYFGETRYVCEKCGHTLRVVHKHFVPLKMFSR